MSCRARAVRRRFFHRGSSVRSALLPSVFLIAFGTAVFGQGSVTATLRGTVTDPTGGVLPGASVSITNSGTANTREIITDARGGYLFAGLFPGTYEMKVELAGFKAFDRKNVVLSPNDTRGLDVVLEVGAVTQRVEVTAQAEVVQTETGAREGLL